MAKKRMFSLSVIDTDAFLEMPCSTQALYFHLCMRADDDGFVASPKIITRTIGASEDDFKLLIAKRFVILFDDGVIVIKHWRMHNTISRDRYIETAYTEDKKMLRIKPNNAYTLGDGEELDDTKLIEASNRQSKGRRAVDAQETRKRRTQYSIDKNSIDKIRLDKDSIEEEEKRKRFSPPTLEEVQAYCIERGNNVDAQHFVDHYTSNGWLVGKNKMRDWKAAVRTWEKNNYGSTQKTAYDNNDDLAAWASKPESEVW